MDFTRRSFLKGVGAVSVGLLFSKKLDRVLGELEQESFAEEPQAPGQKPSAATITCVPQRGFRPERLLIAGTVVGTRMVPSKKFVWCPVCDRDDVDIDEDDVCEACAGLGGTYVETGEMEERAVTVVPWVVEDITIGAHSQFAQSGGIPGAMFAADAVDSFVSLDVAQAGTEIRFRVRYVGDKPEGERFRGALIGQVLDVAGGRSRAVLPIDSVEQIVA